MDNVTRLLMQGAAGAGGDTTYVDDVFSTYLYKGTSANRRIENGLKLGNANAGNSVAFGGFGESSDYLQMAHTTDLCFGNGDFTIECWAYAAKHDGWNAVFGNWDSGTNGYVLETVSGDLEFYWYNAAGSYTLVQGAAVPVGEWSHLCVCRSGNTLRVFVNGTMYGSGVSMTEGIRDGTTDFTIGGRVAGGGWWDGNITNLRVTKGQGLYTSNFTPSTAPFTTTSQGATASNVKLLCCNKDTVTGSTVTPGTITAFGSPTASNFGTGTASDGEGGLTWIKARNDSTNHFLYDTERGAGKQLNSDNNTDEHTDTNRFSSFNSNGFSLGNNAYTNDSSYNYSSWSFRKAKGFFDIVTYTGNGDGRTISHSLGSIPGSIWIKCTSQTQDWVCYHRGSNASPEDYVLRLNDTNAAFSAAAFNNTLPTSTNFSLGTAGSINGNGETYVAYIFAGGASTAATARSVDFDGSDDQLNIADNTDFELGNGDFTLETWVKSTQTTSSYKTAIAKWVDSGSNRSWMIRYSSQDIGTGWSFFYSTNGWDYGQSGSSSGGTLMGSDISDGQWHHIAVTRTGGKIRTFTDGILNTTVSETGTFYDGSGAVTIGGQSGNYFDGQLSNVRLVKGTALYTSSFKRPTEPLTNVTNTKLLCCNNSSVTGSTVTPGTITASSSPTASTDSPFDDPEGFKFGEEGDQNIIKCGSYVGASGANNVNLGWEPQWVMVKNVDSVEPWVMVDSMRGWANQSSGAVSLKANSTSSESVYNNWGPSATGWVLDLNNREIDMNEQNYIYIAIRRPDGYVGKPPEAGTDVFNIDFGNGSSTGPAFDANFAVDALIKRAYASTSDCGIHFRLTPAKDLRTNTTDVEGNDGNGGKFDYMNGVSINQSTSIWGLMWKRHAGLDVVTYKGNNSTKTVKHSLGRVPEMIWIKARNDNQNWLVYHKGLNGGTTPWNYHILLNTTGAEGAYSFINQPTTTDFAVTSGWQASSKNYIAMLFASVEGISKVGSYSGPGGVVTITTGFQPRFIMVKKTNGAGGWHVFDTTRGMGSGNDPLLYLNNNGAQITVDYVTPNSTGWSTTSGNLSEGDYIYYAHA